MYVSESMVKLIPREIFCSSVMCRHNIYTFGWNYFVLLVAFLVIDHIVLITHTVSITLQLLKQFFVH